MKRADYHKRIRKIKTFNYFLDPAVFGHLADPADFEYYKLQLAKAATCHSYFNLYKEPDYDQHKKVVSDRVHRRDFKNQCEEFNPCLVRCRSRWRF